MIFYEQKNMSTIRRIFLFCDDIRLVGFEVLTAVSMKIAVFWVVAPCSPDDGGSKDL
jgi:hypothetical protein